mmetsp:Transcript_4567/g.13148  ORF Transcript_4567/g.13148 Transcript_4567/m.13148 type:complete len:425 (+) Transcript_4567:3265-4539(+)
MASTLSVASHPHPTPSEGEDVRRSVNRIGEEIHQMGLAAAVANAASKTTSASGVAPLPTPTMEQPQYAEEPTHARMPPPPTTTANVVPRIHNNNNNSSNDNININNKNNNNRSGGNPGYGRGIRGSTSSRGGRGGSSEDIRSRLLSRLGIYGSSPPYGGGDSTKSAQMQFKTQPLTAAQHRRVRILRGMGVGYNVFYQSPPDGSATRKPLSGVVPSKEPLKTGIHSDDDCDDESIVVPDDSDEDEDEDGTGVGSSSSSSPRRSTTKPKMRRSASTSKLIRTKPTRICFQDQVDVMPIPTRHEYSNRIKSRIWSNRYELQENAERNAVEFASEGWNWRNVTEDEGMYICSVSGELVHPAWVGGLPTVDHAASSATNPTASTAASAATASGMGPAPATTASGTGTGSGNDMGAAVPVGNPAGEGGC